MTEGTNGIAGAELRQFVERIERLEGDKQVVSDYLRAVYVEAKARGYTSKYIKAVVRLRKKSPSEREEDEAMLDLYTAAMGMARETPLFRHVSSMGRDGLAREKVIEALKLLAPEDGEFTVKIGDANRVRIWRDKEGAHAEEVPEAPPAFAPDPRVGRATHQRPAPSVPDCSESQAFDMGRQARRDNQPVIANPFPWDDRRRRQWDEGWREEDGGDGMGPK